MADGTPESESAGSGRAGSGISGMGNAPSGSAGSDTQAPSTQGTGTQTAVTAATCLNEIRFPECTAKLVTDTINALASANIRQTEAYIELVTKISKTLTDFINETKGDTSGQKDPAVLLRDYKGLNK
jgi:hypothetical protein